MLFSLGVVLGLVIGFVLLLVSLRASARAVSEDVVWPRWTSLGLGVSALMMLGLGVAGLIDTPAAVPVGMALPAAGVVFSGGRIGARDRNWQTWAGLVLASAPALFMVLFVIAEIFGVAH